MTFEECLKEQLNRHKSMTNVDVIKMCYQATFGAEHLLLDMTAAKKFFVEEYDKTGESDEPIFESLNEDIARVNFGGWKRAGKLKDELFEIFAQSTRGIGGTKDDLVSCLKKAETVIEAEGFDMDSWREELDRYIKSGMNPVHHSQGYRDAEKPAYRVVKKGYL